MKQDAQEAAQRGLSSAEAARHLAEHGRNEVVEQRRRFLAAKLVRRLASPLVAILLLASS